MNYTVILLGAVVIILFYILFKYFSTSSKTMVAQTSLKGTNPAITITDKPGSARYAYGLWLYVNQWSTGKKVIFKRTIKNAVAPVAAKDFELSLEPDKPILKLSIPQDLITGTTCTPDITITSNFPIQKWTYIVVNVDGNFVDLYLDGKLVKSIKLLCTPTSPAESDNIELGTGFDALVADFKRWSTPLTPQDVWTNYMSGNGGNSLKKALSAYGMNVALIKDDVEQTKFAIF